MPRTPKGTSSSARGRRTADVVPNVARCVLGLLAERGIPPEQVCKGLGFRVEDFYELELRLSYDQMRALLLRSMRALGDPAMGLAAGARQVPVSWGLPGLTMLTCETLGEALACGLAQQTEVGCLLQFERSTTREDVIVEARPTTPDVELEHVLVEEAFAGIVAVSRCLVGAAFSPRFVELEYARPQHALAYAKIFRCPIRFDAGVSRLAFERRWLKARLSGYDPMNSRPLRTQLARLCERPDGEMDLVQTLRTRMRTTLDERLLLSSVARDFSLSERTLRRQLAQLGASFRSMLDEARRERVSELMSRTDMTLTQIAEEVGLSDARSLRRARKRWSEQGLGA